MATDKNKATDFEQSKTKVVARCTAIVRTLEQHPANQPGTRDDKRFASKVAQRLNKAAKGDPSLNSHAGENGYYTAYQIRDLGVVTF